MYFPIVWNRFSIRLIVDNFRNTYSDSIRCSWYGVETESFRIADVTREDSADSAARKNFVQNSVARVNRFPELQAYLARSRRTCLWVNTNTRVAGTCIAANLRGVVKKLFPNRIGTSSEITANVMISSEYLI